MDECPTCDYGGLDLSPALFRRFADEGAGVINVNWWFEGSAVSILLSNILELLTDNISLHQLQPQPLTGLPQLPHGPHPHPPGHPQHQPGPLPQNPLLLGHHHLHHQCG